MGIKRIGGGMAVNQITEGVIWKQLLYFFFPILFGTFFQQLYNTADAVIVGQFVGTQALAAVGGATGSLINFFVNLFVGLASGTTVVIAQAYGAHDAESVGGTVHTSVALALAAGLGLTAVGVAAAPWALSAMGTPADIMDFALTYLRVYMLGTIPSFLYNVGSGILRAVGDTRRPLYFLIIACLVNIALDVVLVAVLGMGVLGAALATIFSQGVSAVLVLVSLTRAETVYRLDWKQVRFHGRLLGDILRVGVPAGLQSNMYAISNILIQTAINGFGTATVAAWTAHGKVDGFFWMILGAYGISITTFAGQNFGARQYDRMKRCTRVGLSMCLGTIIALSALLFIFRYQLLMFFTGDAEAKSEKQILANGADIKADVLKLGHHGSSTSTSEEFLKVVSPSLALISCGKDNDYGHPHKETIEKLEKYNIPYERTDIKGTIVVGSDGEHLSTAFPDNKTAEK